MLWRRRRFPVFFCLGFLSYFAFYKLFQHSNRGDTQPESAWLKALKGDKDAFRVKLPGGLAGLAAAKEKEIYPVQQLTELPDASKGQQIPRIQHDFKQSATAGPQHERLDAVKEAFKHSWTNYKQFAWAKDELLPVTGGHRASFGNWSATLIDSLDTLWLMGMKSEFAEALEVVKITNFDTPDALPIDVFEVTIRYLGGLLAAFDVSDQRYPVLLEKAVELGNMLIGAFDTHNRMPVTSWHKKWGERASASASIAALGSLSLEFTRLSQLTADMRFYDAVHRIAECMTTQQQHTRAPGLFPNIVNIEECNFKSETTFSLGAFADSAYEYLPKMHLLLNGSEPVYQDMYLATLGPITTHLLQRPMTAQKLDILLPITYKATLPNPVKDSQMQHLSCFAGGMLALGSRLFSRELDLSTASRLTDGCVWAYNVMPSGIMAESFYFVPCPDAGSTSASKVEQQQQERPGTPPPCEWNQTLYNQTLWADHHHHYQPFTSDFFMPLGHQMAAFLNASITLPQGMTAISKPEYRLRPEAIESVFILYRITGEAYLREAAWDMFQAIVKSTITTYGFSSIANTMLSPDEANEEVELGKGGRKLPHTEQHTDRQETFWTAETLKYFFLIFSDEEVGSLDRWVYNTEAHLFRLGKL
ncbi:Mannosyl-oligosaccharide alpha-1,2-mannosidase 1B [Cyphellophora attinorum]|uniref:alpha-1,2-Mannosidase n=1 Tax=Cyphellophora attinorum TaxID=1664694 RepID=A0A0N1H9T7_9EURO|nr:Mannosyl-oligosaccharide alpha-1,2-mannosidase 1B [Phialophora attinorum]KPI39062.1 Mannosyl-oligosaccharide alpha-1,2-mannosidase 1B [Phialophora attinorum]